MLKDIREDVFSFLDKHNFSFVPSSSNCFMLDVRRPGADSDYDTYVDRWFDDRLAAALAIAKKMAESAGVDLSDALRDLQSAVVEAYPKSEAAKTYPKEVAAAAKQIEVAVAARRQRG